MKKIELTRTMKYVVETKTFHQGIGVRFKNASVHCHFVTAKKGVYFTNKKIAFSVYRKPKRLGFGFSFFEWSLLFLLKKGEN